MSAFATLRKDHERIAALLDQLEETTSQAGKKRENLFSKLKVEFEVHSLIEERCLYPALADIEEAASIVEESLEEHDAIKERLANLDSDAKDTDDWTESLKELKSNIEHHVSEEEGQLFKIARQVLSEDEVAELEEEIEAEREEVEAEVAN